MYFLTEADLQIIRRIVRQVMNESPRTSGRIGDPTIDHQEVAPPDVYIARAPEAGIAALRPGVGSDPAVPGVALCQIYKLTYDGSEWETVAYNEYTKQVFNLSLDAIPGNQWMFVTRDNSGKWLACAPIAATSTASPWIAGLTSADCIELRVVSANGKCIDVPVNQVWYLEWDAGDSRWESVGNFLYDGGSGAVNFTLATPIPTLTIGGVTGYFLARVGNEIRYEFGGSTLCSAASDPCNNTFVVALSCSTCPVADSSTSSPTQLTVGTGDTDSLSLPVYTVDNSSPLNFVQFTVDNEGTTGGISQLTIDLVAPDGTVYQLVAEPTGVTSTYGAFILDPGAATALSALTVANPDPALGVFRGVVDFSAYTGPKNGVWQLTVDNTEGDEPITVSQFTLTFGSPGNTLTVTAAVIDDTGTDPFDVELSWTIGGTGSAIFVSVDWDDGNPVEFYTPTDTPQFRSLGAGSYTIVVRAWQANGTYAEDTVAVTVTGVTGTGVCGDPFIVGVGTTAVYTGSDEPVFSFTPGTTGSYDITLTRVTGLSADDALVTDEDCAGAILATVAAETTEAVSMTSGSPYFIQHLFSGGASTFEITIAGP